MPRVFNRQRRYRRISKMKWTVYLSVRLGYPLGTVNLCVNRVLSLSIPHTICLEWHLGIPLTTGELRLCSDWSRRWETGSQRGRLHFEDLRRGLVWGWFASGVGRLDSFGLTVHSNLFPLTLLPYCVFCYGSRMSYVYIHLVYIFGLTFGSSLLREVDRISDRGKASCGPTRPLGRPSYQVVLPIPKGERKLDPRTQVIQGFLGILHFQTKKKN